MLAGSPVHSRPHPAHSYPAQGSHWPTVSGMGTPQSVQVYGSAVRPLGLRDTLSRDGGPGPAGLGPSIGRGK